MNELIKITKNNSGQDVVSARELHKFLENTDNVNTWFQRQAERAMLEQYQDYLVCEIATQVPHQGGFRNQVIKDYAISLSSAKEIAMLNGGDKGKQARLYFIECERKSKELSLPRTYSEALRALADETDAKLKLQERNDKLEPRSKYFEQMVLSDGLLTMEQASKLLNIPNMGRNNIYKALRLGNVIQKNNTSPFQYYMNKGYFELKEEIIFVKEIRKVIITTFVTQKGLAFLFKFFGLTNI